MEWHKVILIKTEIFGSYDIRGIVGEGLDDKAVELIGKAAGTLYGKKFIVGHDSRSSSPGFYKILSEAIASTGAEVLQIGNVPNPVAYFYGKKKGIQGVYITASHNPSKYNGIKFYDENGFSFNEDELKKIKDVCLSEKFNKGDGRIESIDSETVIRRYIDYWKKNVRIDGIKCAVECFYGSGGIFVPYFKEFNINATVLHHPPKGDFGGLDPEPKPETIKDIQKIIQEGEYDLGVTLDGDADRSGFVDEKGNFILGGVALALFTKHYLKKGDKVIATIDCPSEVELIAKANGVNVIWSKIGHSFIEEAMVNENANFGGEQSNHFYLGNHYSFSDAFASTLLLCEILNRTGKKLSDLITELNIHPTLKRYINCPSHEVKLKAMEKIKKELLKKNLRSHAIDGVKIFLNDLEWVLVRVSNTIPAINIGIEAKDEKRLKEIDAEYTKLIEDIINGC